MVEHQTAGQAGESAGAGEAYLGFDQPLDGFDALFPTAPPPRGEQGVLFADPVSVVEENLGYPPRRLRLSSHQRNQLTDTECL